MESVGCLSKGVSERRSNNLDIVYGKMASRRVKKARYVLDSSSSSSSGGYTSTESGSRSDPPKEETIVIKNIQDLIQFCIDYEGDAIDWHMLWRLVPALIELNSLVGMKKLKSDVVDIIVYHIQGLHVPDPKLKKTTEGEMYHCVIMGPPGVGKTTVAKILAKVFAGIGITKTDKITIAKKTDFIARYLGQTEHKVAAFMEKAKGGVLFIDEAYSFGHPRDIDSYSKTIIDMLNQHLSEDKKDFVCMIAGYEKELEESFFAVNPGLQRRFTKRFTVEEYSGEDLFEMLKRRVDKEGWTMEEGVKTKEFVSSKKESFPNYGGDIETYFGECKKAHALRILGLTLGKRVLTVEDLKNAHACFIRHSTKKRKSPPPGMFM